MQKLLLADDSVTIQRVIELTFSGEDIQVIAVNDGEQAIARIPSERPDIVLADIGMPKKGGYDVAAFVKGRPELEHIPVLLLAGAFEPVDQARAEQVRCDGVLIKPFEPRQVIERVRELLDGAKGSPSQAVADVPRPVERLSPRSEPQPAPAVPAVAAVPPPAAVPTPPPPVITPSPVALASGPDSRALAGDVSETELALDEYFESLNAAFDSVGRVAAPRPAPEPEPAPSPVVEAQGRDARAGAPVAGPGRRRGDSLDHYFDRLSTAFEHARPADVVHELPDGFDEVIEDSAVPTVDELVAEASGHGEAGHGANGHGPQGAPVAPSRVNGYQAARNPIVAALEAMLSAGPPAPPVQPTLPGLPAPSARSDAGQAEGDLAEAVTHRVLERLLPEITATVQRVVREEVARIDEHH